MRLCCSQWRRDEFESGGTGPEQKWGAPMRRKKFFGRAPPLFGSKSTISRFGERFRDGQYSLVSFLFAVLLYSRCPRVQPFVKVGGTCPPCPMESAPLVAVLSYFYYDLQANYDICDAVDADGRSSVV